MYDIPRGQLVRTEPKPHSKLIMAFLILLAILAHLTSDSMADYVLYTGEVLSAGQNLTNGQFQLSMQPNCGLVLFNAGKRIWSTNTSGENHDVHHCYLSLKQTGELVVRRNVHYTLWSSGKKSKKGKYALVLESSGRIGVYGQRRWATNNEKQSGLSSGSVVTTQYVLYSGRTMVNPNALRYKNYELGLANCNLAINDVRTGKILWQSNTKAKSCYLQLQNDGEVTLNYKGKRFWSSNKRFENGDYVGVLRFDGRFSVYGPLVWSNKKEEDSVQGFEPFGCCSGNPARLVVESNAQLDSSTANS